MFEFKVVGLSEASVEIDRDWPTKIVSLVSRHLPLEHRGPHHLIIRVEDVGSEEGDDYPTNEMLDRLFYFADTFVPEDRVLVHCFAGQSRSTAAMIAILMQHGETWAKAHKAVIENRDIALPNRLIIWLLDERFKAGGRLVKLNNEYVSAKLREQRHVPLIGFDNVQTEGQVAEMKRIMDLFK